MHTETEEYAPVTVEPGQPAHPDVSSRTTLLAISFQFARRHWLALPSISAFLLIPCFWQRYIVAGDLDSHVYNAWLVQLIERGQAPGLWIARQWDNVLFDMILSNLGNIFGVHAAERIGVVLSVLIFFWGAFSLIAAATRHAPWFLIPCLAILACCLLGVIKPRKWHWIGFAGIAALYFFSLYEDTSALVRIERQAERLVATLPLGARVTSATWTSSDIPLLSNHVVDRACIGRCFSYSNYEPSSGQFGVRALPGNRIAASRAATSIAMQLGSYTVRPEDLPLFQIFFCHRNSTELCMRELPVGPPR